MGHIVLKLNKKKKKKKKNNNNNPINECLIKEVITIEFLFIYYYK